MGTKSNKVFIATSLDGFISDKDGGIDFLDTFPEINTVDTGYHSFTAKIDAMVMGRATFEKVLSFGIEWPYIMPVFVLSNTLKQVEEQYKDKVFLLKGSVAEVLEQIHQKGYHRLYIDGGKVIQDFLRADKIDEMVITTIPVLLGGGIPLFGSLSRPMVFECTETKHFLGKVVQNHYKRSYKES
jgi:dihydrofolate reductase